MVIRKKYERLINLGNYENAKIGVELESQITGKTPDAVKHACVTLGKLASSIINQETEQIKKEQGDKNVGEQK